MSNPLDNITPVAVTFRSGSSTTIELKELSLRQLYKFIAHAAADETPQLVALCAGKSLEWVDTLTDESYGALAAAAFNLSFLRAVGLMKSDPTVSAKLTPLLLTLGRNAELIAISGLYGKSSSPAPVTTESAVETPSAS